MSPRTIGDGTRQILEAIRAGHRHGADIMEATAQGGGTVYKVLRRMEERGWITGRWEDANVAERERRPRRRYYRVTADGQAELFGHIELITVRDNIARQFQALADEIERRSASAMHGEAAGSPPSGTRGSENARQ